ncbi:MAG: CBS domain-containing protein [Armatimonadota bacterium]
MNVGDVMTVDVSACSESSLLVDCADTMRTLNVGSVPIVDNDGNLLGIITDRDIAIRAVAANVDLASARVVDFMTSNPVTVDPEIDVEDAAFIMADNQVRRLPVTRGNKLVGIVSLGDLAVDIGEEELMGETLEHISEPVR